MSNTVLIKEVNNNPVLFNVDNAVDEAALEALQAIKMPEAMATEIFGEQANFADNTNCVVTSDLNTPEFPFSVTFDNSKIPEKPKRNTGTLAGIGMPSDNYIDYGGISNDTVYTAPANGYASNKFVVTGTGSWSTVSIVRINEDGSLGMAISIDCGIGQNYNFMPLKKGDKFKMNISYKGTISLIERRFYYAQGEI